MANLNLDEILALFENGERRYAEDPIFKSVADSLKMGLGVYAVLDSQIHEIARLRDRYNEKAAEWSKLTHEYCTIINELKGQLNPEPEFGVCRSCNYQDDRTRMGHELCRECNDAYENP